MNSLNRPSSHDFSTEQTHLLSETASTEQKLYGATPRAKASISSSSSFSCNFSSFLRTCCFWRCRSQSESNRDIHFEKIEQVESGEIFSSDKIINNSAATTAGAYRAGPNYRRLDIPRTSVFEGRESERQKLSTLLMERVKKANSSPDFTEQVKKDVGARRIACTLDGKEVTSVFEIEEFCGDAAKMILPILNQNIGVDANAVIREGVNAAPQGASCGFPSGSDKGELRVGIKKETSHDGTERFVIEFYQKDQLKSVIQQQISSRQGTQLISVELDDASLNHIDDLSETDKQATQRSTKEAETKVVLEVVADDKRIHERGQGYVINCLRLSNSYEIREAPASKKWYELFNFAALKK